VLKVYSWSVFSRASRRAGCQCPEQFEPIVQRMRNEWREIRKQRHLSFTIC
jgi:hypothetical protein